MRNGLSKGVIERRRGECRDEFERWNLGTRKRGRRMCVQLVFVGRGRRWFQTKVRGIGVVGFRWEGYSAGGPVCTTRLSCRRSVRDGDG